jgi:hypothetical protein
MKTWTYGINSLYRTASIDLQDGKKFWDEEQALIKDQDDLVSERSL